MRIRSAELGASNPTIRAYVTAGIPGVATLEAGDYFIGDTAWDKTNKNSYTCDAAGTETTAHWTQTNTGGLTKKVWVQIATHDTVGSAETSFSFSGLTGDTDVIYQIRGMIVNAINGSNNIFMQPNADATAANYDNEQGFDENGSAGASNTGGSATGIQLINAKNLNDITVFFGELYAKTGVNRTYVGFCGDAMGATFDSLRQTGVWKNTATQITSLTIIDSSATGIGVGSHFELWTPRVPS